MLPLFGLLLDVELLLKLEVGSLLVLVSREIEKWHINFEGELIRGCT